MPFKTDTSFLEKLAMGATGTRAVCENLRRQGHEPIELERGSMGYKIWKNIKIKRLRMPDLLCLRCATRVEARAKTQMEISMSHSLAYPERGWDVGLADEDFVALSLCSKIGETPVDWAVSGPIQYTSVEELRQAFSDERVIAQERKGAEEGFEIRVCWPSAVASSAGTVYDVTADRIQYRRATDARPITLRMRKKDVAMQPLVHVGEEILAGQVIASVVGVAPELPCRQVVDASFFLDAFQSASVADRYAAAKALAYVTGEGKPAALAARLDDNREHIFVRLEAAGSLVRLGDGRGMDFIAGTLNDAYLENRLEAIIILGELPSATSQDVLTRALLDEAQNAEIRAGAAWALGELRQQTSVDPLISVFSGLPEIIRTEAARALLNIVRSTAESIVDRIPNSNAEQRAGIAWAAAKSGKVDLDQLVPSMVDEDARRWVAYVIGMGNPDSYAADIEALRGSDPQVYFGVTLLWKVLSSWVWDLEEY